MIYVDTGDTFFPTMTLPKGREKSFIFTANQLLDYFNSLGLMFFVPGDQDFAAGIEFLSDVSKRAKFTFLIANLRKDVSIKHRPWKIIKAGPKNLVFIGVAHSSHFGQYTSLFTDPKRAIKKALVEIKEYGVDFNSPLTEVILLSHSGEKIDESYAKSFPEISWIIGAHDQRFLREPNIENKTNIVQVLSKNHYLGKITIPFGTKAKVSGYKAIEVHENLDKAFTPNPYISSLASYKEKLNKLQETENNLAFSQSGTITKEYIRTAKSCYECHTDQTNFWMETSHASAYASLIKAKHEHDASCIGCHSVGHKQEDGFFSTRELMLKNNKPLSKTELANYWKELTKAIKPNELNLRNLGPKKLKKVKLAWMEVDSKFEVSHNFSSVQCLNCHDAHKEHPFESSTQRKKQGLTDYQNKCISCHNSDQSPGWYDGGHGGTLNPAKFKEKLIQVSCPKNNE